MKLSMKDARRVGLGAIVVLAACTDGTAPDPLDGVIEGDMAIVAADETIEDAAMWSQPLGFSASAAADGAGAVPGRPGGDHGVGHSLSGTRTVEFFDAAGNQQEQYDPLTTDVIHFVMDIEGEVTREVWTATVARTKDMTISGLEGEETHRTWNGEATTEVSRSAHTDDGAERSYEMSGSATYSDVVVPVPGSDSRFPVSGTITREMTATLTVGDEQRTRTVVMTITFDGDETANLVVNGREFEIDLTARDGRDPVRRKR